MNDLCLENDYSRKKVVTRDKLLKTSAPQPDESFIGYLLRLTEANYYDSPSWIMQMAGLTERANDTAFVFNNSLNLVPLERLTGVDRNKLEELIYHPAGPTRKKMGNYRLFGAAIMQYLIRPDRPKICPYCIRETGYTRRVWEIIPITTCPVHKCLLLDECPNCHARIYWNRRSISRCHCELEWRECQSLQVEEHELVVTEHIYRLCNLTLANSKTAQPQINGNPLYQLDLWHFLSALTFVAGQYGGFIDTKGKYIVSLKWNVEIHRLLCKAFPTFNDWPKNFFSFLDWRREQTLDERYSYGLRREFKGYKFVLYAQRLSKPLKFIRKGFEDYLTSQWNGGHLGHIRRLSASARRQAKYLSVQEAKQLLGTTHIYELIESGRLKATVAQQGKRKLVLIERSSLDEFRWELERALSLSQLGNLLALSRKRVLELVDAGFLNPLRGPAVDGVKKWKFSITEAKGLLAIFKSKVPHRVNVQPKKTINFRAVLVKLSRYGLTLSKFLRAVLSGEISHIGIGKGRGLLKFFFLDEQITEFLIASFT